MATTRQLAAIMFTDIVGYTALMGKDSAKALELVRISKEVQKPLVEQHHGKWLKEMGDGAMVQFRSALDAVNCAVEIQKAARAELDAKLRIGIHLGDVTVENDDVYGDGVNVASRLESIADPGGIYISESIDKAIRGQSNIQAKFIGKVKLKNVDYDVGTYAVQGVGLPVPEIKDKKELSGHFLAEVQRRGVVRAGATYLMLAIILILLLPYGEAFLPEWTTTIFLTLLTIGFPISIYFAWNYERSPEGFVKTTSQESWQNPLRESQKKPLTGNFIVSALVLIIAGMYLYPRYFSSTEVTSVKIPDKKSIAVLPLDIIGGDPEGEYFAAGVREEILNHLSLIDALNVKSRSVVDRLGEGKTTQELVSELGLTHYLEGSTQKVGEQIRIIVQLIDAQTNDHLWSENYDRSYENLLDTQSEIAKKIAEALRVTISPEVARVIDKQPTDNPQAWDDYLRAMHYWRRYTSLRKPVELENTVTFLKTSISKDPNFALAYSRLAMAYQQVPFDPAIVFDFVNVDSVLILCNRAIELDPSLSDPFLRRAEYYAYYTGDSIAAIKNYKEALSKGPHLPEAYLSFGKFHNQLRWDVASSLNFIFQGVQKQPESWLLAQMLSGIAWNYLEIAEYEKAEYYFDKALVYAPDHIGIMGQKEHLYWILGQHDKSLAVLQRIMEISPLNLGLLWLGMHYMIVKDYTQSIKYFDEYYTKASETASLHSMHQNHNYGFALLKMGRLKEANEKFEIALNYVRTGSPTPDYEYAKIFSAKGMVDSAYYHLKKAVAGPIQWGMSDHMEYDPLFENIKDEPEFQRLVGIAKEKVRLKREEVQKLEESGVIPKNLDQIELY